MKRFILRGTYFLGLITLTNCIFLFIGWRIYYRSYENCPTNFSSYLIADSHGVELKDYTEVYNVFNFSAQGDSYVDMKRKVRYIISKTKVDTIYITVDNHTLSPYRELMNNLDRSSYYSVPDDYSYYLSYLSNRYLKRYVALFQTKLAKILLNYFTVELEGFFNENHPPKNKWVDLNDINRRNFAKKRVNQQFPSNHFSLELKQSLDDIIKLCREEEITLIGIKFPVTPEYVYALQNQSYKADEVLLSEGMLVYDYQKLFINKKSYFKDVDHLNAQGGLEFTKVLFGDDD